MEAAGKRYITYPSRISEIKLYNIADIHIGARACDRKRLQEDIYKIAADPCAFWFGGGDMIDAISPSDKRWSAGEIDPELSIADTANIGFRQMEIVRDYLKQIKDKCLGLAFGNHEGKYMGQNNCSNLHGWLCSELGVANLGYCCFLDTVFCRGGRPAVHLRNPGRGTPDRWRVRHFIHHGAGSAATPGSKLGRILKFGQDFECDVAWMGHVHDQVAKRNTTICADESCTNILHKDKLLVITGSYLRTYKQGCSGYGEQKGYSPTPIGASHVTLIPDKRAFYSAV